MVGERGDDVGYWDLGAGDGRGRGRGLCGFVPAEPVAEDCAGDDAAAGAPVWLGCVSWGLVDEGVVEEGREMGDSLCMPFRGVARASS